MGKRVIIVLSVILISALAVLGYFLQQGRKTLIADPYISITPKACIVIETVDLQSFLNSLTTGKGLFGETGRVKELETFNIKLKYIADQLNKPGFSKIHPDRPALISFYNGKEGRTETLLSMALPGDISKRDIKELISSSGIKSVIENKKNGISIFKIPFSVSEIIDTLDVGISQGLLLISSSDELITESAYQMVTGGDIRDLQGFSRVLLASGKNEDKIFIIFRNLTPLLQSLFSEEGKNLAAKVSRLAGTAGGDIYINEDGLVLSGYTETSDSSDFLNKFKYVTPKEIKTYKVLPASTVLFETIILPDGPIKINPDDSISARTYDFADKLKEFIGDEITRACFDIRERPVSENMVIIYELSNRVMAEQLFLKETETDTEILYFQPDDQVRIPVYKTSFKGIVNAFLPELSHSSEDAYFAFYDNYLITGSSFVTVSRLLYDNLLNKTLANDLIYSDFRSTLPSRAGYFFYCVPSRLTDFMNGIFKSKIIYSINSNRNSIKKIQAIGYQLASSNGMIYNSISVKFKEVTEEESLTEWETLLDTSAAIKPFFFTNHITGAKEIFVQDSKNNTYLINAAGRVLWKVPLNEKISGNIFMIDYYRNGKYQLLFSGKNYIHILDRNGNYVERYPVKLRSPATNSIALFDYDNNLNYRLFIAGEDKLIYSYEKSGNVVKGWKPFRTAGLVNTEINYFKVSGKDYLVASDENSIYFLDRSGNLRVSLKEQVKRASGSALRLSPGSDSYLVCTSPDGTVQQIYFDGTVKKFVIRKFNPSHTFDVFDVDGNGFGEYVYIDDGILYVYDYKRTEIFKREFGSAKLGGPINFVFSGADRKIGVYDIDKKLIFLVGKSGETINGFPLKGASMFSIGKLSEKSGWHLIVGGTDRFLYNYKIDTGSD